MKRLLITIILLTCLASNLMAQNVAMEELLGMKWNTGGDYGVFSLNLNTADGGDADTCSDTIVAYSINPPKDCTIDKFRVFVYAKAGTLGSSDITASLQGSTGTAPDGSSSATYSTLTSAAASGMFIEWAGFNDLVSRGTQKWIVVKNCNATPASNSITLARGASGITPLRYLANLGTGDGHICSTDGGSTWSGCTSIPGSVPPMVVECSEGYSFGFPVELGTAGSIAANTGSAKKAYASNEVGAIFTTPADAKLRVIGITCDVAKQGTPTGPMRYRLYQGTTNIADTDTMAASLISTSGGHRRLFFSSTQELAANTSYRISVASGGAGDSSSNAYGLAWVAIENDAESLALKPFGGTYSFTSWNGSSWTDTTTQAPNCAIILDNSDFFGAQSSGSAQRTKLNQGLN